MKELIRFYLLLYKVPSFYITFRQIRFNSKRKNEILYYYDKLSIQFFEGQAWHTTNFKIQNRHNLVIYYDN